MSLSVVHFPVFGWCAPCGGKRELQLHDGRRICGTCASYNVRPLVRVAEETPPLVTSDSAKQTVLEMMQRQLVAHHATVDRIARELGQPTLADVRQNLASALQALGTVPRVHGNGFIQLDLNQRMRLHVWGDPRIPRQASASPIHDHRFGFQSFVLRGALMNVTYAPVREWPEPEAPMLWYRVWVAQPRDGEDTVLVKTPDQVRLTSLKTLVPAGRHYAMDPGTIHESQPQGLTVTVLVKTVIEPQRVGQAFLPEGQEPDNTFNRNTAADPEFLWQIIEEALF